MVHHAFGILAYALRAVEGRLLGIKYNFVRTDNRGTMIGDLYISTALFIHTSEGLAVARSFLTSPNDARLKALQYILSIANNSALRATETVGVLQLMNQMRKWAL